MLIDTLFCIFRPKKWNESLSRPHLDYSEIFDEDVGQIPGKKYIYTCS